MSDHYRLLKGGFEPGRPSNHEKHERHKKKKVGGGRHIKPNTARVESVETKAQTPCIPDVGWTWSELKWLVLDTSEWWTTVCVYAPQGAGREG